MAYPSPTWYKYGGEIKGSRNRSTHDKTICGATWNEGRLNSTEVEGDIGDLLNDLPLLVALIVIIGVKRIYVAKSRCKSESLLRTHDEVAWQT